ncbi:uncharacterized protein F4822DRAFT_391285 [Hypoxylon trugodes]|uniref:uncharacterized protein n=1 Tax=Hypoxylon trugodes TaxID=326681 RepID=UPI0021942D58|nr:uncharacterized protein F4822DRAFT_391285 [Hypoxylon trugodes]KAI1392513.1 hypothetical protein F4822DRAFT_391285 [Hypoxylon trugodes]
MFEFVEITLFLLLISILFTSQLLHLVDITLDFLGAPSIMDRGRGGMLGRIPRRRNPLFRRRDVSPPNFTTSYEITPEDALEVRDILSEDRNLPPELVDMILEYAEYWACSVAVLDCADRPDGRISIRGGGQGENQFLLRTEPLGLNKWSPLSHDLWKTQSAPKSLEKEYPESNLHEFIEGPVSTLEHPFRKVVFDIVSCDQGWSSHHDDYGTYRNSFTWFDVGLERFDMNNECPPTCSDRQNSDSSSKTANIPTCAIRSVWPPVINDTSNDSAMKYKHELLPTEDHCIQRNKHAEKNMQHHHIEWSWDDNINPELPAANELEEIGRGRSTGNGEFIRNLKFGDMITVWGRARFGGWSNNVQSVKVKLYWAF